jgi:hypothetical protein
MPSTARCPECGEELEAVDSGSSTVAQLVCPEHGVQEEAVLRPIRPLMGYGGSELRNEPGFDDGGPVEPVIRGGLSPLE